MDKPIPDCLKPNHGKRIEVIRSEHNTKLLAHFCELQNATTIYMLIILTEGMKSNHLEIPCELCWRATATELRDMANLMEELIGDKIVKTPTKPKS